MGRKVDIAKYESFLKEALVCAGLNAEDAENVAGLMIQNEKLGISTHGSFHLVTYIKKMQAGAMDPHGEIEVIKEGPTWAVIDAHNNMGFLASYKAMELAIKKAKEYGMAYVTVTHSSHYGTGAAYELMASRAGMASIVFSNTWKLMAVPGSREPVIGNSPIGYGLPATKGHPEVFMDVATSAASNTKVMRFIEAGEDCPPGWIVDADGKPTTDPSKPHSLVPAGAHKGYGAAFMIEALTAFVAGGGRVAMDWIANIPDVADVSHGFLVIDISQITGADVYGERLDEYIDEIHNAPKAAGADRIFVPGEIEQDSLKAANEAGYIELMDVHVVRMQEVADMFGLDLESVFID
ncbi:MAG: Ldh family oxidoreductase [Eubacterium sp.]|nr:Ldh family oxidoreductase [Eubacterium sp.]